MLDYIAEIRVTIELILILGSMWWTIRTFALASSRKDQLRHEEDDAHEQLGGLQSSIHKLEDAARKLRDKVLPGQEAVIAELRGQVMSAEKSLERSQLPAKVKFYLEVREFYESNPTSMFFRGADWVPQDDSV